MQTNKATFFGHAKVRDLSGLIDDMNRKRDRLVRSMFNWIDLAENVTKTKWMLVSTPQFSLYHSLHEK